jgi:hypothetical protein
MNVEQLLEWQLTGEIKILGENPPHRPYTGLNLGHCGGNPVTNRLIYSMAIWPS